MKKVARFREAQKKFEQVDLDLYFENLPRERRRVAPLIPVRAELDRLALTQ